MPRQTETPMRHSCDRCHNQKLRCARTGIENTGACIRCQQKHVPCIYSFSLPKGRPSVYEPIAADHDPPSTPLPPLISPPPASPRAIAGQSIIHSIKPSCVSGIPGLLMDWQFPKDVAEDTDPGWAGSVPVQASPDLLGQTQHPDARRSISEASSRGADSDVVIGQLSQLSIRLSRLCRSAEELASPSRSSTQPGHEVVCISTKPLIDAIAFDSVASWLAHGSTGFSSFESTQCSNAQPTQQPDIKTPGGVLYYLFSASHFMLEILRDLPPNTGAMPTTTMPSLVELNSFDSVICHLSIGCYSSLMNIYISVLDILEHDATLSSQTDRGALGDIRLVSIVQICSYLTERQNQAIDLYLSAKSSKPGSPWQNPPSTDTLQSSDTAIREEMTCLKMEVQQRLSRLQQILCF